MHSATTCCGNLVSETMAITVQAVSTARYNADLANDLGNLLNRTLGLVSKNFGGIPEPTTPGEFDDEIQGLARETD